MITAIDTNGLIDVFSNDPEYGTSSAAVLRDCIQTGAIVICEVVLAEIATVFEDHNVLKQALNDLPISFNAMTEKSALYAAKIWRSYRNAGGQRKRMVADFFVRSTCYLPVRPTPNSRPWFLPGTFQRIGTCGDINWIVFSHESSPSRLLVQTATNYPRKPPINKENSSSPPFFLQNS
ncbi:type II toxin-antitoxin system VapC family toxin [bacterium]|nr:type II toxin-antitoxin system VapC family toxin [bacterium]